MGQALEGAMYFGLEICRPQLVASAVPGTMTCVAKAA